MTTISSWAFIKCTSLTEVVFEGDVEVIEQCAFDSCEALETIILVDSITTIEKYAFSECESLVEVTLPTGLKTIGGFAFVNSGLLTLTVPAEVELEAYDTTSFTQTEVVTVIVSEGSWADLNFDTVFYEELFEKQ